MTLVAFPMGISSPVQIESAAFEALAPDVAEYIDREDAANLQGLLDFYDIPEEVQPEAARQLASEYAQRAPAWAYDSVKVERAAERLVRRTPDQVAARREILELFSRLNNPELQWPHTSELLTLAGDFVFLSPTLMQLYRHDQFRGKDRPEYTRVHREASDQRNQRIAAAIWKLRFFDDLFLKEPLEKSLQRMELARDLWALLRELAEKDKHWRRAVAAHPQSLSYEELHSIAREAISAEPRDFLSRHSEGKLLQVVMAFLENLISFPRRSAFDPEALKEIMPRLAHEDRRRAVRLMAAVAAKEKDEDVGIQALLALGECVQDVCPLDHNQICREVVSIFTRSVNDRELTRMMPAAAEFMRERILPTIEPSDLLDFAATLRDAGSGSDVSELGARHLRDLLSETLVRIRFFSLRGEAADPARVREAALAALAGAGPSLTPAITEAAERRREELARAGFGQLGDSEYFMNSDFVVQITPQGKPVIFTVASISSIDGIRAAQGAIEFLYRKGAHYRTTGNEEGILEFAEYALERSLEEQLARAGFEEVEGARGIFSGGPPGGRWVVGLHEGTVWFMGRPWRDRYDVYGPMISDKAEILPASAERFSRGGGDFLVRNGPLELRVDREGSNIPRLLGPLEGVPGALIKDLASTDTAVDRAFKHALWAIYHVESTDLQGWFDEQCKLDPQFADKYGAHNRGIDKPYLRAYCDALGLGDFYEEHISDRFDWIGHVSEFEYRGQRFFGLALTGGGYRPVLVNVETGAHIDLTRGPASPPQIAELFAPTKPDGGKA